MLVLVIVVGMTGKKNPFVLNDKVFAEFRTHLDAARTSLESVVDDARREFDERSGAWQDSERGEAVSDWLDSLQDCAEAIAAFPDELAREPG